MEPGTVNLNKELSEIKQSLEQIKSVLGIGKVTPATIIQLKREAHEKVAKINERWKKRNKE